MVRAENYTEARLRTIPASRVEGEARALCRRRGQWLGRALPLARNLEAELSSKLEDGDETMMTRRYT